MSDFLEIVRYFLTCLRHLVGHIVWIQTIRIDIIEAPGSYQIIVTLLNT